MGGGKARCALAVNALDGFCFRTRREPVHAARLHPRCMPTKFCAAGQHRLRRWVRSGRLPSSPLASTFNPPAVLGQECGHGQRPLPIGGLLGRQHLHQRGLHPLVPMPRRPPLPRGCLPGEPEAQQLPLRGWERGHHQRCLHRRQLRGDFLDLLPVGRATGPLQQWLRWLQQGHRLAGRLPQQTVPMPVSGVWRPNLDR